MTASQAEPQKPLNLFGAGEAHAIALAYERSWLLRINDARPLQMALALGIKCVAVPDFRVLLYSQGRITRPAVQGYLRRLASTTQPALIRQAQRIADLIADERGESR